MFKEETRVRAGYEEIVDKLLEKKAAIEEMIRKQVEEETRLIDETVSKFTKVVQVEVADEVEEVNEETYSETEDPNIQYVNNY